VDAADQGPENGNTIREEIARLEARIETLTESLDRCQKISLMARFVLAVGGIWLALIVVGVLPFAPFSVVGAIAALIGGIVLFGSNASTWKQTTAAIAQADALRSHLISRVEMQTVEDLDLRTDTAGKRWFH